MENSIDLQNTKNRTTHDPAIPLLDIYSKKKAVSKRCFTPDSQKHYLHSQVVEVTQMSVNT
jgi:hypothetical protein